MLVAFLIAGAVFLFLFLVTLGWVIATYNGFINLKQSIKTAFSNIKTEYQRRADLFCNLVETVKSHKKFEKSTLKEVVEARAGSFGKTMPEQIKKMGKLDGLFSKLLAIFEQYPNLKSSEQHNKIMDEIRITEDRINVARTSFNSVVRDYNVLIKAFPSKIIGRTFGFTEEQFYINEPLTDKAPKISLSE